MLIRIKISGTVKLPLCLPHHRLRLTHIVQSLASDHSFILRQNFKRPMAVKVLYRLN